MRCYHRRCPFCQSLATMTTSSQPVDSLIALRDLTRQFASERAWQTFHTPKNLAMALSVEAAELMEHFQWLQTGASHYDEVAASSPAWRSVGGQIRQALGMAALPPLPPVPHSSAAAR